MVRTPRTSQPARLACILGSLVLVALVHPGVEARTWRVQRDGSGDFTTIQPAIDAAAEGDTILIGPGRYAEMAPDHFGEPSVGCVDKADLTFIGIDRDQVIIGPETPDFQGFGPNGFSESALAIETHYESMTVENVFDGLGLGVSATVSNCTLRGCSNGINAEANLIIDGCTFVDNKDGLQVVGTADYGTVGSVIRDCVFEGSSGNGVVSGNHWTEIVNAHFLGGEVGLRQTQGRKGTVIGSTFLDVNLPVWANVGSEIAMYDCRIEPGGDIGILLTFGSHLSGSGNHIAPARLYTLDLQEKSTADFHGSDILFGEGAAVRLQLYEIPVVVDLSSNYWGTTDLELIDAKILDREEQVGVVTEVIYEPILTRSIPTKTESMGSLKSRYRDQN